MAGAIRIVIVLGCSDCHWIFCQAAWPQIASGFSHSSQARIHYKCLPSGVSFVTIFPSTPTLPLPISAPHKIIYTMEYHPIHHYTEDFTPTDDSILPVFLRSSMDSNWEPPVPSIAAPWFIVCTDGKLQSMEDPYAIQQFFETQSQPQVGTYQHNHF